MQINTWKKTNWEAFPAFRLHSRGQKKLLNLCLNQEIC